MSLDGLPPAHLRVLLDGLPVLERYGLPLAGGYAFRAHKMVHRPSQDLDFATRGRHPAAGDRRAGPGCVPARGLWPICSLWPASSEWHCPLRKIPCLPR